MTRSVPQGHFSANADHETHGKEISSEVLGEQNATAGPALGTYLMLGVLMLASIGGMLVLCYKCEHPDSFQIFQSK